MREYEIEVCAASLEMAIGHAVKAGLPGEIVSELRHALAAVRANAEEANAEEG